ncbi:hypothetical protein [Streptomyces sp. NBC_00728]|uniref:hypothetical protein n=1 Tax=Streptomyces sp. NBC_00728 TaxID=2903676 RepID=UPI003868BD83
MDAIPAFVDHLLDQGSTPDGIPEIRVSDATGWLTPLTTQLLNLMDNGMQGAPVGAFLAHGYAHLPLPARDGRGLYLRMAYGTAVIRWPVAFPSVVLTVHGTLDLEMYPCTEDLLAGRPQYARRFGPEEIFAVHPGALCTLQSSADGLQALAVTQPEAKPASALTFAEHGAVAERARRILEGIYGARPVGVR